MLVAANGIDFEARTLYINGEITHERNLIQIPALRIMDETEGPITVIINSVGGDSDMGVALYDMLRSMRNTVTTINVSRAFSIAAIILQGGSTRLMLPHAQTMIHNGYLSVSDPDIDNSMLEELKAESDRSDAVYHAILQKHTGQKILQIERWCETDTYFDAKESLKFGFVDAIIDEKYLKQLKVKT